MEGRSQTPSDLSRPRRSSSLREKLPGARGLAHSAPLAGLLNTGCRGSASSSSSGLGRVSCCGDVLDRGVREGGREDEGGNTAYLIKMAEENIELRRQLRQQEQQIEALQDLRTAATLLRRRSLASCRGGLLPGSVVDSAENSETWEANSNSRSHEDEEEEEACSSETPPSLTSGNSVETAAPLLGLVIPTPEGDTTLPTPSSKSAATHHKNNNSRPPLLPASLPPPPPPSAAVSPSSSSSALQRRPPAGAPSFFPGAAGVAEASSATATAAGSDDAPAAAATDTVAAADAVSSSAARAPPTTPSSSAALATPMAQSPSSPPCHRVGIAGSPNSSPDGKAPSVVGPGTSPDSVKGGIAGKRRRQRLHYLYASPLGLPALDVEAELRSLDEASHYGLRIAPQVASVLTLGQAVLDEAAWIHLTAHTARGGRFLMLEDPESLGAQEFSLPVGGLQTYLQVGGGARCPFLFLSACESEQLARVFFTCGVKNVVFCPTEVQDSRARRFACALYGAMVKNLPLKMAFAQASLVAKLVGDDAQYGLFSSEDLCYLPPLALRKATSTTVSWSGRQALRRKVEDFVGRKDVIGGALFYLNSNRSLVLLHCEESLGRSATLREIAYLVTMPGRKFSGENRCAFFPNQAPGGLLIVDDLESLNQQEQEQVRSHLETPGAQLLAASRYAASGCPFEDLCKTMSVQLSPLRDEEAADLFLRRCRRPLRVEDLLPPQKRHGRGPKDVLGRADAAELLKHPIRAFKGVPGRIRKAVDNWAQRGSPALQGDVESLAWVLPNLHGTRGLLGGGGGPRPPKKTSVLTSLTGVGTASVRASSWHRGTTGLG